MMPGSACISRSTPPRRAAAAAVKPGKGRKRGGGGAHAHNGVHEGLAQDAVDDGRLADAPGAVEERLLLHATAEQDKRRHKSGPHRDECLAAVRSSSACACEGRDLGGVVEGVDLVDAVVARVGAPAPRRPLGATCRGTRSLTPRSESSTDDLSWMNPPCAGQGRRRTGGDPGFAQLGVEMDASSGLTGY